MKGVSYLTSKLSQFGRPQETWTGLHLVLQSYFDFLALKLSSLFSNASHQLCFICYTAGQSLKGHSQHLSLLTKGPLNLTGFLFCFYFASWWNFRAPFCLSVWILLKAVRSSKNSTSLALSLKYFRARSNPTRQVSFSWIDYEMQSFHCEANDYLHCW